VTTAARSPTLPDVPTIAEGRRPRFYDTACGGLSRAGRVPAEVKAKLAKDCAEGGVKAPAVVERPARPGATRRQHARRIADFIRAEYDKWGPVIKAAGSRLSDLVSLRFDAGVLDHLRPFDELHLDEVVELVGRARHSL